MLGEEKEFSWTIETHEHKERTTDWYWTLIVLAVVAAGVSVFFGNVLFAIIMALGVGSILFLAARGPREHTIRIDERGLSVDGTRYPYKSIHSYWIERGTENPRLFITMSGIFSPHLSVQLTHKEEARALQQHLSRFIDEEEQGPHIGENLSRMLGI